MGGNLGSIITSHPFVDGNKRTAFETADTILRDNGYFISAGEDDILECVLKIASYSCSKKQVTRWLKKWIRELEDSHLG